MEEAVNAESKLGAFLLPIGEFLFINLKFFDLRKVVTKVVDKFATKFLAAFGGDNTVGVLVFFTANLEFNLKHKPDYTLFLVKILVAAVAAASSAFCLELPLPLAMVWSPRRTATLKIF